MSNSDLDIGCKAATIEPEGAFKFTVKMSGIDLSQIMDDIGMDNFLEHFGWREILDEIGKDKAKGHFDLNEDRN